MISTYGRPIAVFWYNLTRSGAQFSVDDTGQLLVKLPDALKGNPYVKDEITKRRQLLIKLLDKRNIDPLLAQYVCEPLTRGDADTAITLARKYGIHFDVYAISGDLFLCNARPRQAAQDEQIRAAIDSFGAKNGISNLNEVLEVIV